MRKFLINVNGNSYEVEVEEIGGKPVTAAAPAPAAIQQTAAPAAVPSLKPTVSTPVQSALPAKGIEIKSPLPGVILSVNISVGDTVKKGDVLLMIEAMKMENEIMAPSEGTVLSILTSKDSTVNTGDLLVVIG